jgi:hypothetical protein
VAVADLAATITAATPTDLAASAECLNVSLQLSLQVRVEATESGHACESGEA